MRYIHLQRVASLSEGGFDSPYSPTVFRSGPPFRKRRNLSTTCIDFSSKLSSPLNSVSVNPVYKHVRYMAACSHSSHSLEISYCGKVHIGSESVLQLGRRRVSRRIFGVGPMSGLTSPKPLPILNPSHFVHKKGSSCKGDYYPKLVGKSLFYDSINIYKIIP